jgi:hypothetical protein
MKRKKWVESQHLPQDGLGQVFTISVSLVLSN